MTNFKTEVVRFVESNRNNDLIIWDENKGTLIIGQKNNGIFINTNNESFKFVYDLGKESSRQFSLRDFSRIEQKGLGLQFSMLRRGKYIIGGEVVGYYGSVGKQIKKILPSVVLMVKNFIKDKNKKVSIDKEKKRLKLENERKQNEKKRIQTLNKKKGFIVDKFDKDNNGTIDIFEDKNEFNLLLKKHQKVIIEKGKEFNQNYTHQFIKVGNYIKQKRSNLQLIFDCIKQVQNQQDLDEYVEILENEIHSYNLLLINSLNLIVSLIEDDQITFYDIYEKFDKLNIYNSNWENEISQKLTSLNKGISELNSNIKGLMYEIRDMGDRIVNSIEDLSYITEESTRMLDNRLGEIDSSIKTNNLLTLIQTYQIYKINKNTKSLRE